MTKMLLAFRNVANALKNITLDVGSWGMILWRDLNNGKWASVWELGRARNCFVLGSPAFDPVAGWRYFGIDM